MRNWKNSIPFLLLFVTPIMLFAQKGLVNMNREFDFELEAKIYQSDSNLHTSVKPYSYNHLNIERGDSKKPDAKFFLNNIIRDAYKKKNGIFVLPLFSTSGTAQFENSTTILPEYSAGVYLKGFFGDKFTYNGFYRYVSENLPNYLDSSIYSQQVIPSIARPTNGSGLLTANHWEGYLAYNPNRFFAFLIGKGKNFWGDGYRSLLLSDNAASYPFFRIESTFWKVKYVNLYSWHNDFTTGKNRSKFTASHFLSWNITKNINLGLFETVIWQGSDTLQNRGFDVRYLNPAIFYRSVEYSNGSSDNSIIGMNLKIRIGKNNILYGQGVLDEFLLSEMKAGNKWWANKYGYQLGFKMYDLFGVKNLGVQTEFNAVRPFTYSHATSMQNYATNNQSLAHPVGSNFYESANFIRYKKEKWYFEEQFNLLIYGQDTSSVSYGGNMLLSYSNRNGDYNHKITQGEKHTVLYNSLKVSYELLKELNLRAFVQATYRLDKFGKNQQTTGLFQIGISSRLWNEYRDY